MSVVQVVNVRGIKPGSAEAAKVVYCGRSFRGWPGHPLANPHPLDGEDTPEARAAVLAKYRTDLLARPTLEVDLARLWVECECGQKPLACWCSPKACHCDCLAELLTERFGKKEPTTED